MTPTLQTRKDGSGDCVRACIAGLLGMKIETVPDFTGGPDAMLEHPTGYEFWYLELQQWLAGKGFMFLEVQLASKTWMPLPYETFAIFIGERATTVPDPEHEGETLTATCRHAIVGKCEGADFFPMFDPLGGNPLEAFVNNKIQAVCFLVPVDPALQVRLGVTVDKTIRLARQLPFSEIKNTILAVAEECFGIPQVSLPAGGVDPNGPRIITRDEPQTNGGIILPNG